MAEKNDILELDSIRKGNGRINVGCSGFVTSETFPSDLNKRNANTDDENTDMHTTTDQVQEKSIYSTEAESRLDLQDDSKASESLDAKAIYAKLRKEAEVAAVEGANEGKWEQVLERLHSLPAPLEQLAAELIEEEYDDGEQSVGPDTVIANVDNHNEDEGEDEGDGADERNAQSHTDTGADSSDEGAMDASTRSTSSLLFQCFSPPELTASSHRDRVTFVSPADESTVTGPVSHKVSRSLAHVVSRSRQGSAASWSVVHNTEAVPAVAGEVGEDPSSSSGRSESRTQNTAGPDLAGRPRLPISTESRPP